MTEDKLISCGVKLPSSLYDSLNEFVEDGRFPSISAVLRRAAEYYVLERRGKK